MSVETLERPEVRPEGDNPSDLEFGVEYKKPEDFSEKYSDIIKKVFKREIDIERMKREKKDKLDIEKLENINENIRSEIAGEIAKKYFLDNFRKGENGYLNALIPTKSCIPRILQEVLDITLNKDGKVTKDKLADIHNVFAEIYDNYRGKEDKPIVKNFDLKILIKRDDNVIQFLAGNSKLENELESDSEFDLNKTEVNMDNLDDILKNLSEGGRGMKLDKILADKFEIRTNDQKTEYAYFAEMKY